MHQVSEECTEAKKIAENVMGAVVGDVMNTIYERNERPVDANKLQSLGNEEAIDCVNSEGMGLEKSKIEDKSDQTRNMEVIDKSSTATQGEGDFQHPYVRESKAFYHLGSEGVGGKNQLPLESPDSSFTDELITQLHSDINSISLDDIQLSDSEVEKEISTTVISSLEDSMNCTKEPDHHKLRHSQKFFQINNIMSDQNLSLEEEFVEIQHEDEIKSTNLDDHYFTQTDLSVYPFTIPTIKCVMGSSHCIMQGVSANEVVEGNLGSDGWVEANEVEITEPGCSKDNLESESIRDDLSAIKTRQYWSNVGLITEREVDRRYIGPVDFPAGLESVKGVRRVESKCLTNKPEELIWATEVEPLEESISSNATQGDIKVGNYLSYKRNAEESKKKKSLISKLTKSISSIFKFNNK